MEELKQRILKDGVAKKEGGIVRVGSFLNHQMDPQLMMHCAEEFARLFAGQGINKIVTIEASGIAPAILMGYIRHLPVVFVKKKAPKTIDESWKSWVWGSSSRKVLPRAGSSSATTVSPTMPWPPSSKSTMTTQW